MGINSGIGLNYSLGVDADGNNNKFHINRIDDADGFKQNLLTIKSDGNVESEYLHQTKGLNLLSSGGYG